MPQEPLSNSGFDDSSEGHEEFGLLQSLLVEPETEKLRDKLLEVERDVEVMKRNTAHLADVTAQLTPRIEKLVNRKLDEFRQELMTAIQPLLEELIDERVEPGRIVSVQVKGVRPDA